MKKLFLGKLSYNTTEDKMNELFAPFGPVRSLKIISDSYSGRSRGFGFVELEDDSQAAAAIEALNGMQLDGFEIVVNEARDDQSRDRPRSNGAGRSNRDDSRSDDRGGYARRDSGNSWR